MLQFLSERSKKMKKEKKKECVFVAKSAYNSSNIQFGLVMKIFRHCSAMNGQIIRIFCFFIKTTLNFI